MAVRSHWLVGVLVALTLFVIIVASDSNEIKPSKDERRLGGVEGRRLKVKRSESVEERDTGNDLRVDVEPSLKRFVLFRPRFEPKISNEIEARAVSRKGDEAVDRGMERAREERIKRGASPSNGTKSAEKARLDQIRVMHESWKSRECSANFDDGKRSNRMSVARSRRNAITANIKNDDYYAQKKAVMDRYYAREKEIEAKYGSIANRLTDAPDRVQIVRFHNATNEYIAPYNISDKNAGNSVSKTNPRSAIPRRTKASQQVRRRVTTKLKRGHRSSNGETETQPDENGDEYGSGDYYDSYEDASNQTTDDAIDKSDDASYNAVDGKPGQTSNNTIDVVILPPSDTKKTGTTVPPDQVTGERGTGETLKWGNCTGGQVYQHNLNVSINHSSLAYVNLLTMLDGSICVTCIRAIPLGSSNVQVYFETRRGQDGGMNVLKLHFRGSEDVRLSYVVKIWAVEKYGDRCEVV